MSMKLSNDEWEEYINKFNSLMDLYLLYDFVLKINLPKANFNITRRD